ncbi:hypothetical protein KIN20_006619 [Parelaphostrongylus tenuis]|uniref:Uncharacterized protein n=1 Tax=Parelaphostrongylus tenuis TaxID=148309 RepID=A0AAD5MUB9_PARTN|nr:hypothetical protein KIN20_006619 [Parelaphostrongylus tenuis]
MKTLRGSRPVKKRIVPQITRPSPLPQFNHFSVLRSDDEDGEAVSVDPSAQECTEVAHERDPHWWSDEEEVVVPENAFEIVSLVEELIVKVCKDMNITTDNEEESCKDSWSDDE